MATITFKGKTVQTSGALPETGAKAPDFLLTKTDFSDITLSDLKGKNVVFNIFPSVETSVCAESVRRFNNAVTRYENTEVLCISRDLPFALARFNAEEGLENIISASELRNLDFGRDYGLRILDGPLAGLLARAVVVISENGSVMYTELVSEIGEEPDYESALRILESGGTDAEASAPEQAGENLEACTKAPEFQEQQRFADADEACDDGRSGKI